MKTEREVACILFVPGLIMILLGLVILGVVNSKKANDSLVKNCIHIDEDRQEIGFLMEDRCDLTNHVFKAGRESARKIPLRPIE